MTILWIIAERNLKKVKNNSVDNIVVSVIVCIYNGEDFLRRCVKSVIEQTYRNLEIILVDDGSTDKSGEICDALAKTDKRIKVIHKKNGGVSSARNFALEQCIGEYVCIIDQDDWIEKDYVDYLLKLAIDNNVDVAMVPQVIFTTDEQGYYSEKRSARSKNVLSGEETSCLMLNGLVEIGPWNKIFSKKIVDHNKIKFNTQLFGGDGYVFSIELFMASKKVAVGYKGIYHYRIDNYNSEMSKFRLRTARSSFKAVDILKNKFSGTSEKMDKALDFAEWDAYYVFLIKMIACNMTNQYKSEYDAWKRKLRKNIKTLLVAELPVSRKIKYFFIAYFTEIFRILKKIKRLVIKNKMDRDYSKSK